jgi:hypothetical protein
MRCQKASILINWTIAFNYKKFLRSPFASQYEIEQVIIGLISDQSGVTIKEIHLQSGFTNDLSVE